MSESNTLDVKTVGVIGTGVIGASWSALFLAAGLDVVAADPAENAEQNLNDYIANAWPTLRELGLAECESPPPVRFVDSPVDAVKDAQFVQESIPERLPLKHELFALIEPHLHPDAVVASSASGLMVSEMQKGWKNPSRFILGHPFNPPHLIPLVELLANDQTDDGVLEITEAFYQRVGKVTIRVNKEVPAHVANRLQAALWREALALVQNGVASVGDVDKAVWAGPGLRWAAMGPHMLFHLGAGTGGIGEFCNRYADSFHRWWDDLDDVRIDEALAHTLAGGVRDEGEGRAVDELSRKRDALITSMLQASRQHR
ncbi:MAG: 3-hydroxyacyl-CoA dehydrogenase NAD-binding domain-containing protein [Pseudomonadota bacterium]